MALQLTNIIRDVSHDAAMGRIYLPMDLMERHGVAPESILAQKASPQLTQALRELAELARDYYAKAKAHRTPEDRSKLLAAETMRRIYSRVLRKIEKDGFRVFQRRYRLSKLKKLAFLGLAFAGK
jgi:15-cis-phytoene synthase